MDRHFDQYYIALLVRRDLIFGTNLRALICSRHKLIRQETFSFTVSLDIL